MVSHCGCKEIFSGSGVGKYLVRGSAVCRTSKLKLRYIHQKLCMILSNRSCVLKFVHCAYVVYSQNPFVFLLPPFLLLSHQSLHVRIRKDALSLSPNPPNIPSKDWPDLFLPL